jgi:hypothetical protein
VQNQRAKEFNKTGKLDYAKHPQPHTKPILCEQKELTSNEWNHFKALLEKAKFWEQPIEIKYELSGTFDGCGYIFEGHKRDNYWFISRNDNNIGQMRECIEYLLTIK